MSEGNWARTCPKCGKRYRWGGKAYPEPPCPHCTNRAAAEGKSRVAPVGVRVKASGVSDPGRPIRISLRGGKPPAPPPVEADTSDDSQPAWEAAVEQCDDLLAACLDLPSRAEDFAFSVREKVESIRDWIVEHEHVTEAQLSALDNMNGGVDRWLERS